MRLLLYSPAFLPLVGGLETSVAQLAESLVLAGHDVTVVTTTLGPVEAYGRYRVVRRPGPREFLRWFRWCEVFYQANISLKGLWPLLLIRRPWVVAHHSWYRRTDGRVAWQDRLKRYVLRFAAGSIAVSRAIAQSLPAPAQVIENSYRDELFRTLPGVSRSGDLVFVGRLVSDKGVDLLLEAIATLGGEAAPPRLSVVGEGPELPALRRQAERLGIANAVEFLGTRTGEELVAILNRHRVLVVPSRYDEPFGIVALEGIACGCVVIGSSGGGLADAVGPCGLTFPNGDVAALAGTVAQALGDDLLRTRLLDAAPAHLARHRAAAVSAAYLTVFEAAIDMQR